MILLQVDKRGAVSQYLPVRQRHFFFFLKKMILLQVDKRGAVRQYSARQGHFFFFLEKKILSQVDKRGAVRQYPARQRHSGREGFVPRFRLLRSTILMLRFGSTHIRVVNVSRLYFTTAVLKQAGYCICSKFWRWPGV